MKKALTQSQESVFTAVAIISGTYIVSYILSFIKQRFLISVFGVDVSEQNRDSPLGVFFLADKIPSLIFNAVTAGSVSVALIPAFTKKISSSGKEAAWDLGLRVLNLTLVAFFVLTLLIFIFAKQISAILSLSLNYDPILPQLIKVMMFSQIILIISVFETSVLQSFKRFFAPALAPVFYNIGIILFVVLFSKHLGIFAPAWGMVFGSLLHFLIQLPAILKLDFKYRFFLRADREAKNVFFVAIPKTFGVIADQFASVCDTAMAFFISPASSAILVLAMSLQKLPSAVFGSSFAQVMFPRLSFLKERDREGFLELVRRYSLRTLYFVLPSSVVLVVLRIPIIRLVYGVSNFSWESTILSSYTLAFLSLSISAQGVIHILARAFYAVNDTKTPFKAGVVSILINLILSVSFVPIMGLGVWSLGLSYSIGIIVNLIVLERFFDKKLGKLLTRGFVWDCGKIIWASLATGFFLYIPLKVLDKYLFNTAYTINLLILTLVVGVIGVVSYFIISLRFGISDASLLKEKILFARRKIGGL
jgi:putative peptidoglycan lipid II flippase